MLGRPIGNKIDRICKKCNKKFIISIGRLRLSKTEYCSQKCYFEHRYGKKQKHICKNCSIEFYPYNAEVKKGGGKFCSKKCYIKWNSGSNHKWWDGGHLQNGYTKEWTDNLRESIRRRDGYKCKVCGVPQTECIMKLHVHHIDYNKNNCNSNNLISLCYKHHLHTNTEKTREYWIGYFTNKMEALNGF